VIYLRNKKRHQNGFSFKPLGIKKAKIDSEYTYKELI